VHHGLQNSNTLMFKIICSNNDQTIHYSAHKLSSFICTCTHTDSDHSGTTIQTQPLIDKIISGDYIYYHNCMITSSTGFSYATAIYLTKLNKNKIKTKELRELLFSFTKTVCKIAAGCHIEFSVAPQQFIHEIW